jgi:hypothetical protein
MGVGSAVTSANSQTYRPAPRGSSGRSPSASSARVAGWTSTSCASAMTAPRGSAASPPGSHRATGSWAQATAACRPTALAA